MRTTIPAVIVIHLACIMCIGRRVKAATFCGRQVWEDRRAGSRLASDRFPESLIDTIRFNHQPSVLVEITGRRSPGRHPVCELLVGQ